MNEFQPDTVPAGLSAEQKELVQSTLRAILQSKHFAKSKRYPALLEYSVKSALEGHHDVKERVVGTEVFGRPADYDPSSESVVRNAASEVRRRLALYYSENLDAPVRIELPFGGYIAQFDFTPHSENGPRLEHQVEADSAPVVKVRSKAWRRWVISAGVLLVAAILFATWGAKRLNPGSPVDRFWGPIVRSQGLVTISLGDPFERAEPSWVKPTPEDSMVKFMQAQPNSPVPDITGANPISQYLAGHGAKPAIEMADSIQFTDLHRAPAVLIGAGGVNPWYMRLESSLRFQFRELDGGGVHAIIDSRDPTKKDWSVDIRLPYNQIHSDYALITRQLNPDTGQWWIGIGGTSALSTEEAERVLLDSSTIETLEAALPRGWENKNVQIVVQFTLVNGNAGGSRVMASTVW